MSAQYREPALSLNEQVFLRQSLAGGLRLDGRSSTDFRSVALSFPGASGTAQAIVGHTRVLAVTTADLVVPFPDRPNEGALNLFVNFSPVRTDSDAESGAARQTDKCGAPVAQCSSAMCAADSHCLGSAVHGSTVCPHSVLPSAVRLVSVLAAADGLSRLRGRSSERSRR